jgi:hypothetical protein
VQWAGAADSAADESIAAGKQHRSQIAVSLAGQVVTLTGGNGGGMQLQPIVEFLKLKDVKTREEQVYDIV